jgi:hypothetical protein
MRPARRRRRCRTGRGEDALAGADGDLAALRHGLRAVLEIDQAAGDDLDAGLVAAIGQQRQIVELSEGAADSVPTRRSARRAAHSSAVSLESSSGRIALTLLPVIVTLPWRRWRR